MTCRLTRRDFLRAASGAAGLLATGPLAIAGAAPSRPASGAGADAVVALARGTEPGDAVRRAVAAAGGISAFVSRGDVVVLKPNIGWDRTPEQAANTHPEVVAAVAELCLRAGAKSVRVFDRTCNDPRRCYATSGIQAAVEALAKRLGAEDALRVYHAEDRHFVRAALPGATVLKEWPLHRDALEADRIVNVPVAKHHSLARVTAGLKNLMGVMGGNRGQVHYRLPEALVDLNRRLPSALTVVDATRVLVRNGPTGGNLADVQAFGTVFAAAAVVAADAVVAERIFGLSPADVPHIRMALEAGIGATSPSRVRVIEA